LKAIGSGCGGEEETGEGRSGRGVGECMGDELKK
jgi:hypothetical protein